MKYNVYEKKTFTMEELMQALEDNFEGHDRIWNIVCNKTPKYGNDDDYASARFLIIFFIQYSSFSGLRSE